MHHEGMAGGVEASAPSPTEINLLWQVAHPASAEGNGKSLQFGR